MSEPATRAMTPDDHDKPPAPLCGPAEFEALVAEMVAEDAPRAFAIVQVLGERADGRIAAWGLRFEDRIELVSIEGDSRMHLTTERRALARYSRDPDVTAHLIWLSTAAD